MVAAYLAVSPNLKIGLDYCILFDTGKMSWKDTRV